MHDEGISIWFFVGVSLLVNGLLVLGAGLYDFVSPPLHPVVLYELHAGLWLGSAMTVLGAWYCLHFRPRRHAA